MNCWWEEPRFSKEVCAKEEGEGKDESSRRTDKGQVGEQQRGHKKAEGKKKKE